MRASIPMLIVALIIAASVSANPITYGQEGHLQLINAENNVLEAIFIHTEGGIRIYGDNSSITIASMSNNEVLMSGSAPSDAFRLYRVLESNFLQHTTTDENGQRRKFQFIVPESLADRAKEDLKTRKEQRITSQLTEQSAAEVQTAEEQAFMRLFARQELSLIRPAAKALGRAGVMGYENRGALLFYGIAMALGKAQHRQNVESSGNWEGSGESTGMGRRKRFLGMPTIPPILQVPPCFMWGTSPFMVRERPPQCSRSPFTTTFIGKRSTQLQEHTPLQKRLSIMRGYWCCRSPFTTTQLQEYRPLPGNRCCSCRDMICRTGICIPGTTMCNGMCPDWLNCYGMCGGGGCTECIREMCGTCCYQKGCFDHDRCCEARGYMSFSCMYLFDFECTRGFVC